MGQGFEENHIATLGADFSHKDLQLEDVGLIRTQIWDIAGQEVFKLIRGKFLGGTKGAILVYDCTREDTLPKISEWLNDLWTINKSKKIPILIVGNKIDLKDEAVVTAEDALKYIETVKSENKLPFIELIETSAKTGENVKIGFEKLAMGICENLNLQ